MSSTSSTSFVPSLLNDGGNGSMSGRVTQLPASIIGFQNNLQKRKISDVSLNSSQINCTDSQIASNKNDQLQQQLQQQQNQQKQQMNNNRQIKYQNKTKKETNYFSPINNQKTNDLDVIKEKQQQVKLPESLKESLDIKMNYYNNQLNQSQQQNGAMIMMRNPNTAKSQEVGSKTNIQKNTSNFNANQQLQKFKQKLVFKDKRKIEQQYQQLQQQREFHLPPSQKQNQLQSSQSKRSDLTVKTTVDYQTQKQLRQQHQKQLQDLLTERKFETQSKDQYPINLQNVQLQNIAQSKIFTQQVPQQNKKETTMFDEFQRPVKTQSISRGGGRESKKTLRKSRSRRLNQSRNSIASSRSNSKKKLVNSSSRSSSIRKLRVPILDERYKEFNNQEVEVIRQYVSGNEQFQVDTDDKLLERINGERDGQLPTIKHADKENINISAQIKKQSSLSMLEELNQSRQSRQQYNNSSTFRSYNKSRENRMEQSKSYTKKRKSIKRKETVNDQRHNGLVLNQSYEIDLNSSEILNTNKYIQSTMIGNMNKTARHFSQNPYQQIIFEEKEDQGSEAASDRKSSEKQKFGSPIKNVLTNNTIGIGSTTDGNRGGGTQDNEVNIYDAQKKNFKQQQIIGNLVLRPQMITKFNKLTSLKQQSQNIYKDKSMN